LWKSVFTRNSPGKGYGGFEEWIGILDPILRIPQFLSKQEGERFQDSGRSERKNESCLDQK